jgi:hypothetical protein
MLSPVATITLNEDYTRRLLFQRTVGLYYTIAYTELWNSLKVRATTADQRCYILRHGSEPAGSATKDRERTSLPGGPFQIGDERPGDRLELARRGAERDDSATEPTDARRPTSDSQLALRMSGGCSRGSAPLAKVRDLIGFVGRRRRSPVSAVIEVPRQSRGASPSACRSCAAVGLPAKLWHPLDV